jgi:chorismate mutase
MITNTVDPIHSPDEHPFTPRASLPKPILPPLPYPTLLHECAKSLNVNSTILDFYIKSVVPVITRSVTEQLGKANDDGNYGSSATRDVECLQAISRRIHCGQYFMTRQLPAADPSSDDRRSIT